MKKLILVASATLLIPLIDYLWIGLLMKPFYMDQLGSHKRMVNGEFSPKLGPAILVYIILATGLVYFTKANTWLEALFSGALLGLTVYGVYDLTNASTLANYSYALTATDTAWGILLCAVVSLLLFFEARWLNS